MHAISYQLKRCHLSAVAIGRKIFRGTTPPEDPDFDGVPDMTPARFDILYLVLGRKKKPCLRAPRAIEMTQLRKALGLAGATISKAVKRLVVLGLVTCELRANSDRNKVVALTDEGEARIKRALHLVFTKRALTRHYQQYVVKASFGRLSPKRPWRIAAELTETWEDLQSLARHHFDKSTVLYDIRGERDFTALPPRTIGPVMTLAEYVDEYA
jgi:DNA-binding MarR family transcriptional regulator